MMDRVPAIIDRGEITTGLWLSHAVPALAAATHAETRRRPVCLAAGGGDGSRAGSR
jgi:hypothetical protein